MNEKTAKYVKLLKSNLDRIAVAVMYGLLLVMVWLWWSEQQLQPEEAGPVGPATLPDTVAENEKAQRVLEMSKPLNITEKPLIDQVAKYNMFDYKSVKEKERINREVEVKYQQAEAAAQQNRSEEAARLLREILITFPTHQKARELLEKIEKEKSRTDEAAGAASAPTGNPAAPAPGV